MTFDPWPYLLTALVIATPFVADLKRIQDRELIRARDKWQVMMATVVLVALGTYEPWLAFVGLGLFMRWRTHHALASVVPWGLVGAQWALAGALPAALVAWLPVGWLAVAAGELALAAWQWRYLRSTEPAFANVRRPIGTYGQRTLLACWFALVLPFWLRSWWGLIPALGLLLTSSWLAVLATFVGLAMMLPGTLVATVPLVAIGAGLVIWTRLLEYTPRGDTVDSIRQRMTTWRIVWAHLRQWPTILVGRGPYTAVYDLLRWSARYSVDVVHGHFHCEPLEFVYEYGVPGALALVAFAVRVVPHLAIGEPWSAAVVTGAVMACGTLFARCTPLGATWLAMASVVAHR